MPNEFDIAVLRGMDNLDLLSPAVLARAILMLDDRQTATDARQSALEAKLEPPKPAAPSVVESAEAFSKAFVDDSLDYDNTNAPRVKCKGGGGQCMYDRKMFGHAMGYLAELLTDATTARDAAIRRETAEWCVRAVRDNCSHKEIEAVIRCRFGLVGKGCDAH